MDAKAYNYTEKIRGWIKRSDSAAIVLVLISCLLAPLAQADGTLQLLIGESTTLQRDYEIGDAAITNPAICDYVVRDGRREIYLNGIAEGSVTLTLWDSAGVLRERLEVYVSRIDVRAMQQQLRTQLAELPVEVSTEAGLIIIAGEVHTAQALARVHDLAAHDPSIHSRVTLSSKAMQRLAHTITSAIARPGITARNVQGRLLLEGTAYSEHAANHAAHIAQLYAPNVMNLIDVHASQRRPGKRPLIVLDVYFMEVKKSALKSLGIHWNPGAVLDGADGSGGIIGSAVGFVTNLLPKLRWANEQGFAKVLEHPQIVVKSGDSAQFFSGSEVPYSTSQSIEFKDVGISIDASPIAAGQDVDLQLNATISSLGSGVTQAIDRRTVSTSAYCASNQSIVLAGLWSNHAAKSRNKVPRGGATNSAIFQLNRSKDFQRSASEFLIFVRPRIAEEAPSAAEAEKQWQHIETQLRGDPAMQKAQTKKSRRHRMHARFGRKRPAKESIPTQPEKATPAASEPSLPQLTIPEVWQ